mmetsp:Transcript_3205/g.6115  ORF Transcript_3205/g.6115 Transcript_3205/m.6115 type:complete len:238 (-) Transcript_3205:160-873(-)|eukprot:scaffold307_cov162-Amphora_coffeaeformis.AAC.18
MSTLDALISPLEPVWLAMNSATVSILQRQYDDALETFTQVFQDESVLLAWKSRRLDYREENEREGSRHPRFRKKRCILSVTPLPTMSGSGADSSFLNPFMIDQHGVLYQDEENRGRVLLCMCAVSLFNMAVAYHLKANSPYDKTRNQCELLRRARALYLQADLLLTSTMEIGPTETLMIVYLALCNNMAEVEYRLGNPNNNWKMLLAENFCLVPARAGCPFYQHFDEVVSYYHKLQM